MHHSHERWTICHIYGCQILHDRKKKICSKASKWKKRTKAEETHSAWQRFNLQDTISGTDHMKKVD